MGWWGQNSEGEAYDSYQKAENSELVWGDGPADVMDAALSKIMDEYVTSWGRMPTEAELFAGLRFSLAGFDLRKR